MVMEEDGIVWDSELNAAFWDEDAAPPMPPSSCLADRSSTLISEHAAPKGLSQTSSGVKQLPLVSSNHSDVSGSAATNVVPQSSGTPAAATRPRDSSRSAPRVRRFLYPSASQIARDTPDRRRRPRPVIAARSPQTPADQRPAAAADAALTPAEQQDVEACLVTAMETLEDDGDTFFTQCRVRVTPDRPSATTVARGEKTVKGEERTPSLPFREVNEAKENMDTVCEPMETTGPIQLAPDSGRAECSGHVGVHAAGLGSATITSSRGTVPSLQSVAGQLKTPHTASPSVQSPASMIRTDPNNTNNSNRPVTSAPGRTSAGCALPALGSEHRTPAGRPPDRHGRVPPAKRLWSAADNAESENDEPGCSPVLSSHKKRRRRERRPDAVLAPQSPMEVVLEKSKKVESIGAVGADKMKNPGVLPPLVVPEPALGDDRGSFAGFSTASGRKLAVSDQAMKRAVALMREVDGPSTCGDLSAPAAACRGMNLNNDPMSCDTDSNADTAVPVVVSKAVLENAEHVFADHISDPAIEIDVSMRCELKASGDSATIEENVMSGHVGSLKIVTEHRNSNPEMQVPCGFSTASGKPVKVSDAALEKAKAFLDEDVSQSLKARSVTESQPVVGFATASGKSVKVSDAALKKAKAMLDSECDATLKVDNVAEPQTKYPVGFATASGKSVNVSDAALKKAKAMLDGDCEAMNNVAEPQTKRPVGFATASGKSVEVSDAALKKAKAMLDSECDAALKVDNAADSHSERPVGFATASGKSVRVSDAALKKAKALLDSECDATLKVDNVAEPQTKHPVGFATASGKSVKVSDAALKKAKAMLDSEYDVSLKVDNAADSHAERPVGFATASGKSVRVSDAALKKAKAMLDSDCDVSLKINSVAEPQTKHPVGFATASGKSVKVSDSALKKAKAMLDSECDASLNVHNVAEPHVGRPCQPNVGFATASGKSVTVSDAALKRAKAILDSVANDDESLKPDNNAESRLGNPDAIAGTSGGSVKTLPNVRNVETICDDDETMPSESAFQEHRRPHGGFSTAGGRPVEVSKVAMKNAKAVLDSISHEPYADPSSGLAVDRPCGFTTAAGNSVQVSEDALRKAKAMLASVEETMETETVAQDSSTTGERPEPVTDAALKKPRAELSSNGGFKIPNVDRCARPGLKRRRPVPAHSSVDGKHSVSETTSHGAAVAPVVTTLRQPKVRFLCRDNLSHDNADLQSDACASKTTSTATSAPVATSRAAPVESLRGRGGSSHRTSHIATSPGPPATVVSSDHDHSDSRCVDDDAESNTVGLTQLLDDRFEFTQVVTDRQRLAEEERSTSPVLGTPRRAGRRRRSAQPAVFRTPYRSGPAPHAPAKESHTPAAPPPPEPPAVMAASPAPTESASGDGRREVRAEQRRRQAERVAAGADRRVVRSVGSLMQTRQEAAAVGTGRKSLREALGPRPANLTRDELQSLDVPAEVLDVTFASAPSYRFKCTETMISADGCVVVPADDDTVGVAELRSALLSSCGVQPSLVPERWVENAFRHVVWKLAAYERQFPDEMAGRCLTVEEVIRQLRYRYDRELDRCQRPALRRITEGDDTAAKTLILCVAEVNTTAEGIRLVVSDGWYCIPAQGDSALQRLVRLGRLRPGLKLAVHGAELTGQQEPCSPLEVSSETFLRFSTNSCRRARWDARLGYHSNPAPFASCLSAVLPDGGSAARLDVAVARVYPVLYYEKGESGGVFRTARCERRRAAAAEAARESRMERLYAAVERQLGSQERPAGAGVVRRPVSRAAVRQLSTGQQIYECVAAAADPGSVEALLTDHQKELASEYQRHRQEEHRGRVEAEFRARLQEEAQALRPAAPLLKIRLAGKNNVPASGAILTLWRPSDELQTFLAEGKSVSLLGVTANGKRNGVLQLSAGSQLRVQPGPAGLSCPPRVLASAVSLAAGRPPFGELDVAALVVRVTPGAADSQTVHLCDRGGTLLAAVCWPGLKSLGLDELVVPGAVLAFSNLQLCSAGARPPLCSLSDRAEVSRRPTARRLNDELRLLVETMTKCSDFEASAGAALDSALAAAPGRTMSPAVVGPFRSPVPYGAPSPGTPGGPGQPAGGGTPTGAGWSPAESALYAGADGDGSVRPAQRRLQALTRYGPAPPISPLVSPVPAGLRRPFRSPRPTIGDHRPGAAVGGAGTDGGTAASTTAGGDSGAAAEIIRLAKLELPSAATDSPPIEPESQLV
ncbi:breast cancer type 2 susceptibility protein homolog [Amphibalanus amphitrite]|uniref:breast cancer type 2 susceptibility protein homolog n=1 Tax=Amphibalanus amphitrite TaxID=1232801 RepID=UPI001C91FBB9|nr:breast cancer type 2 susceptibility protein homolog [Amphibalanus amphitrite]